MASTTIPVIHFNDVYKMTRPKRKVADGLETFDMKVIDKKGEINTNFQHVVAFYEEISRIRSGWDEKPGEDPKGLLLFSGDAFSPSVESMLTNGRNMLHLMNELAPDASVPGNHEFDFGRQRFDSLIEFCNFKWVVSNITEQTTSPGRGKQLKGLREYIVFERAGLRIGVIGLVSADSWKKTNSKVQSGLKILDMLETCKDLVPRLRKSKEEKGEACDLIFALTHGLHTEDIELARSVGAYPADHAAFLDHEYGVDVLLGGHDHQYFSATGITRIGEPLKDEIPASDKDNGVLVLKSGYDFYDLSKIEIEVGENPQVTHRKKVIKSVTAARRRVPDFIPGGDSIAADILHRSPIARVLKRQFDDEVLGGLDKPVATMDDEIDLNSVVIRQQEMPIGNWIADALLEWHLNHLTKEEKKAGYPKVSIINAGGVRGDGKLGPGEILARDIIQLLPFYTLLSSLRVTGKDLKVVLNAMLKGTRNPDGTFGGSGHFPVVGGMRVTWSSKQPEEDRVLRISIPEGDNEKPLNLDDPNVYVDVLTNEYLLKSKEVFGLIKPVENLTACEELPMYQILLNYINDLQSAKGYDFEDLEQLARNYPQLNEGESEGEPSHTEAKIGDGDIMKLVKNFIAWFSVRSGETVPYLLIPTERDGRMKDADGS